MPTAKTKDRPVLVTTEFRGVFFGYAKETAGDVITLRAARNCIYWSSKVGGFLGLAEKGPDAHCRIGAPADVELRKIASVAEVSKVAEAAWIAAPVYRG
jgi:hypothetical protein